MADELLERLRRMSKDMEDDCADAMQAAAVRIAELTETLRHVQGDGEDDIGYLVVDTIVGQIARDGAEEMRLHDGFREFYKPDKWLGSHRAAAAYLSRLWLQERQPDAIVGECVCMCAREHTPEMQEVIREGYGAVIIEVPIDCMARVGLVIFKTVRLQPEHGSAQARDGQERACVRSEHDIAKAQSE
jgi:hypothetical protein